MRAAELRILSARGFPRRYTVGAALYDALEGSVIIDGATVELSDAEATALTMRMRAEGKVVTFAELTNALGRRDDALGRQRVRSVVWTLRRKLSRGCRPSPVESEPRIGYRISPRVTSRLKATNRARKRGSKLMTIQGWVEILVTLCLVVVAAKPIGVFMARVFEGKRTFLSPALRPVERGIYRLAGVDKSAEQGWLDYTLSMILFTTLCFVALYAILRLQDKLPLNPQGFAAVSPDLAFNIAISFITNANWQAYGGETTLSHFSQMAGLTAQNMLNSAVAIGIALALTRALQRREAETIGNFWVDVTRATLYLLLPLSAVAALAFIVMGVPQTLQAGVDVTTLEGAQQTLSLGPVATQEAIKLIGDNGGGFFNANSAHPFENPNALSNVVQNWSQLVLPVALVFAFGKMVGDARQGRALLITMAVIFLAALSAFYWAKTQPSPALATLGVDQSVGNFEGKELRFSQAGAALFVDATTGTGTGASNAVLESMTPIAGLAAMFNLMMGCISPGGVGAGLYSLLLLAVVAAFLSGLMVGRTPDFLGKKFADRDSVRAVCSARRSRAAARIHRGVRAHQGRARFARRRRPTRPHRDPLRLRVERLRQRLVVRRAQRRHPVVQRHYRHSDAGWPPRPRRSDPGDCGFARHQEEGGAFAGNVADRRSAVHCVPDRRRGDHNPPAVLSRRSAGTDRRAFLLSARRCVLTSPGRFALGLVGSKPRDEFVIRAGIAEAHLRHRFVAEPCSPCDDEARSANGQRSAAPIGPAALAARIRCSAIVQGTRATSHGPGETLRKFSPAASGTTARLMSSILVTERPPQRVMANFHRQNARIGVDGDALAIGPSGATPAQLKNLERIGKPERGHFCAHVADLQHRRLAMWPADEGARLAAALDQPRARELGQRLAHRHA